MGGGGRDEWKAGGRGEGGRGEPEAEATGDTLLARGHLLFLLVSLGQRILTYLLLFTKLIINIPMSSGQSCMALCPLLFFMWMSLPS